MKITKSISLLSSTLKTPKPSPSVPEFLMLIFLLLFETLEIILVQLLCDMYFFHNEIISKTVLLDLCTEITHLGMVQAWEMVEIREYNMGLFLKALIWF